MPRSAYQARTPATPINTIEMSSAMPLSTQIGSKGWSRPYSRMRLWIVSGDTRPERNRSIGLPGAMCTSMNEMIAIPMRIGIDWSNRRKI